MSPDNAMEGERKGNSVKMQPRNVKLKSLVGPPLSRNKFGGPPSLGGPVPLKDLGFLICSHDVRAVGLLHKTPSDQISGVTVGGEALL